MSVCLCIIIIIIIIIITLIIGYWWLYRKSYHLMGAMGSGQLAGSRRCRLPMLTGTILTPAAFAIWKAPFLNLSTIIIITY